MRCKYSALHVEPSSMLRHRTEEATTDSEAPSTMEQDLPTHHLRGADILQPLIKDHEL